MKPTPKPTLSARAHLRRVGVRGLVAGKKYQKWGVAQLAERLAVNQEVGGSSPPAPVVGRVGTTRLSGLWAREAVFFLCMFTVYVRRVSSAEKGPRGLGSGERLDRTGAHSGIRPRIIAESRAVGASRTSSVYLDGTPVDRSPAPCHHALPTVGRSPGPVR